jgi:hypothetical protein
MTLLYIVVAEEFMLMVMSAEFVATQSSIARHAGSVAASFSQLVKLLPKFEMETVGKTRSSCVHCGSNRFLHVVNWST